MRSVLLLRHAKSSWKHTDLTDHDRPLNKRGKRDAPRMGRLLKKEHLVPDIIISSTAIRARATAETVAKASGYKGEIVLNKSLYAAEPEAHLCVLHDLSDEYVRVLVVGHNPGSEELVELLTGEIHLMSTCSLAHVKFRVDKWSEIDNKIKGRSGREMAAARSHLKLFLEISSLLVTYIPKRKHRLEHGEEY